MNDTGVWVFARDVVAIPELAYGVNNDWKQVTDSAFPTFENKVRLLGYTLMRYPGGVESEWYHWRTNTADEWPHGPATPGPTPARVLSRPPGTATSFVARTSDYIKTSQDTQTLQNLGGLAFWLADKFKDQVSIWEIGNEWWLMLDAGPRAELFKRYVQVASHIAGRIKDANPSAEVYVNGDWTNPDEFTAMKKGFGNAWTKVDGVALHIYAGDVDPPGSDISHHISTVKDRIQQVKANTGRDKIYVSEWHAARKYTMVGPETPKVNFQAANVQVELMWTMLRAGIRAAAIWPVVGANPGLNLIAPNLVDDLPPGQVFAWMAKDMIGSAVSTTYQQIPAVAARKGNRLVVFLLGKDGGTRDVTIHVAGYTISSVASAEVMYSSTPEAYEPANIASAAATHSKTDNTVKVTINPGGAGRGSSYEIIRLVLDGVVES